MLFTFAMIFIRPNKSLNVILCGVKMDFFRIRNNARSLQFQGGAATYNRDLLMSYE